MHELDAILQALPSVAGAASPHSPWADAVLATVVHVEGSAYRRPGARMLIGAGGTRIGSVSGGCLEGDVCRKAWWFTEGGQPSVRRYDTSSDDDAVWEFGLGCNGVVYVLFERATSDASAQLLDFMRSCRQQKRAAVVATVIATTEGSNSSIGQRLWTDGEILGGDLTLTSAASELHTHLDEAYLRQQSFLAHLAWGDVFVEWVAPRIELFIFGAGHDAQPLAAIASQCGWSVTVADPRAAYARADRFPTAEAVVRIHMDDPLRDLPIRRDSLVVLMTHNYPLDATLLPALFARHPRYLGLLGPATRAARLFEELQLNPQGIDLHAPVGLDIGAETPETIALSIAAGIQAFLAGRSGGALKHRQGPIHHQVEETGAARTTPAKSELALCSTAEGIHS